MTVYTGNVDEHAGHDQRLNGTQILCVDCAVVTGRATVRRPRRWVWQLVLPDGFVAYQSSAADGEQAVDELLRKHEGATKTRVKV